MSAQTGTELLMHDYATTRLDAIVLPILRQADHYATCRAMAAHFDNTHGDMAAMTKARADLDKMMRDALTKLAGQMALCVTSQNSEKEKP